MFMAVCLYLMSYDIWIYVSSSSNCEQLLSSVAANNTMWFTSRSVSCYLWVLPIIRVFWPKVKQNGSRHKPNAKDNSVMRSSIVSQILETQEDDFFQGMESPNSNGGQILSHHSPHFDFVGSGGNRLLVVDRSNPEHHNKRTTLNSSDSDSDSSDSD